MSESVAVADARTVLGHPRGLVVLFFAEMWERFSYYGMRALLVFYMLKGFLGMNDDRGLRRLRRLHARSSTRRRSRRHARRSPARRGRARWCCAAVLAGIDGGGPRADDRRARRPSWRSLRRARAPDLRQRLLQAEHLDASSARSIPQGDPRRDGGFTIFYMGINLGAALSPLVCGYIGETYGWHYGFGLATLGMLAGVAVFVRARADHPALILAGALATSASLLFLQNNAYQLAVNGFVAVASRRG